MSDRIDKEMLSRGLVKTRSQARMLIKQGDVLCNSKVVTKPGLVINSDDVIEIKQDFLYVSRGALKLKKAIEAFELDFKDKIIADCGASTGGFTQVSLMSGAKKVYAIDVGHDQLEKTLKDHPQVVDMQGVNLKNELTLDEKVDFCVADLSFISIKKVYPTMNSLLNKGGKSVVLIKPQFEAGTKRLSKNGIVKEEYLNEIIIEVKNWFEENNFEIENMCESPITGKTGNIEYLALIKARS